MSARTRSLASHTVTAGATVALLAGLFGGAACKDGGEESASAPPPVSTPQPGAGATQALLDTKAAGATATEAGAGNAAESGAGRPPGQPPAATAGSAKASPSGAPARRPPAARRGGGDVPEYYKAPGATTASPRRTRWVRLPSDARLGEETVPSGRYEVKVESTDEGPRIVLHRDGEAVASELAVRPTAQPGNAMTGSWLWRDERDERLYRLFSQQGRDLYFVVLEQS